MTRSPPTSTSRGAPQADEVQRHIEQHMNSADSTQARALLALGDAQRQEVQRSIRAAALQMLQATALAGASLVACCSHGNHNMHSRVLQKRAGV